MKKEIENKAGELVEKIVEAFCKDEIAEGKRDSLDMMEVHEKGARIADTMGMVAEEKTVGGNKHMTSGYLYMPKNAVGKKVFVVRFAEKVADAPASEVKENANTVTS
jgi:hypothetical protein